MDTVQFAMINTNRIPTLAQIIKYEHYFTQSLRNRALEAYMQINPLVNQWIQGKKSKGLVQLNVSIEILLLKFRESLISKEIFSSTLWQHVLHLTGNLLIVQTTFQQGQYRCFVELRYALKIFGGPKPRSNRSFACHFRRTRRT